MTKLHFVTGNKGNVGKSVWASAMIEYYIAHQKRLLFIDGDKDSKTLRNTYKESIILTLSDDPLMASQPDILMDLAESQNQLPKNSADILVDLPAGGEEPINNWLEECGLDNGETASDLLPVVIYKWWVSDADPSSIELFKESAKRYPSIKHIFLKNMGKSREVQWKESSHASYIDTLSRSRKISLYEIPVLASKTINFLREEEIGMSSAVETKAVEVSVSNRLRIRSFLKRTEAIIDKEKLFGSKNSEAKPSIEQPSEDEAVAVQRQEEVAAVAVQ